MVSRSTTPNTLPGSPMAIIAHPFSCIISINVLALAFGSAYKITEDKYNMLLAQGNLGAETVDIIIDAVKALPNGTDTEKERKARFIAYLVMASPEYVINK